MKQRITKKPWRNVRMSVVRGGTNLPHDTDLELQRCLQQACIGLRVVTLNIADDRRMFHPKPDPLAFENEIDVQHFGMMPVSRICLAVGVDPQLIQDVHEHYRADELHRRPSRRVLSSIHAERRQIITNLLPFPQLHWWREVKHPSAKKIDMVPLGILLRKDLPSGKLDFIKARCLPTKHTLTRVSIRAQAG